MADFQKKRDFGERQPEPPVTVRTSTKDGCNVKGAVFLGRSVKYVRRGDSVTVDGIMRRIHDYLWTAKNELHLVIA